MDAIAFIARLDDGAWVVRLISGGQEASVVNSRPTVALGLACKKLAGDGEVDVALEMHVPEALCDDFFADVKRNAEDRVSDLRRPK